MNLNGLAKLLEETGLPVTYRAWPEEGAPALPWIAYRSPSTDRLLADGGVFWCWDNVLVQLYCAFRSPETEAQVEAALSGFAWTKEETYVESEGCYIITYEIEV